MSKSVLAISPHVPFGQLIRLSLEESGFYQVQLAENGEEAQKLAATQPFELAIIDPDTKDIPFNALAQNLKVRLPALRVVAVVSANNTDDPAVADTIVDGFLRKPFYLPDLLGLVGRLTSDDFISPNQAETGLPWLKNPKMAAHQLGRLIPEVGAQGAIILRGADVMVFSGQLSQEDVAEIAGILHQTETSGKRADVMRFLHLVAANSDHQLYATTLIEGVTLAVLFEPKTSLTKIRTQTVRMARVLTTPSATDQGLIPQGAYAPAGVTATLGSRGFTGRLVQPTAALKTHTASLDSQKPTGHLPVQPKVTPAAPPIPKPVLQPVPEQVEQINPEWIKELELAAPNPVPRKTTETIKPPSGSLNPPSEPSPHVPFSWELAAEAEEKKITPTPVEPAIQKPVASPKAEVVSQTTDLRKNVGVVDAASVSSSQTEQAPATPQRSVDPAHVQFPWEHEQPVEASKSGEMPQGPFPWEKQVVESVPVNQLPEEPFPWDKPKVSESAAPVQAPEAAFPWDQPQPETPAVPAQFPETPFPWDQPKVETEKSSVENSETHFQWDQPVIEKPAAEPSETATTFPWEKPQDVGSVPEAIPAENIPFSWQKSSENQASAENPLEGEAIADLDNLTLPWEIAAQGISHPEEEVVETQVAHTGTTDFLLNYRGSTGSLDSKEETTDKAIPVEIADLPAELIAKLQERGLKNTDELTQSPVQKEEKEEQIPDEVFDLSSTNLPWEEPVKSPPAPVKVQVKSLEEREEAKAKRQSGFLSRYAELPVRPQPEQSAAINPEPAPPHPPKQDPQSATIISTPEPVVEARQPDPTTIAAQIAPPAAEPVAPVPAQTFPADFKFPWDEVAKTDEVDQTPVPEREPDALEASRMDTQPIRIQPTQDTINEPWAISGRNDGRTFQPPDRRMLTRPLVSPWTSRTHPLGRMENPGTGSLGITQLTYTVTLVPRSPKQQLSGDLRDRLSQWLPQLCHSFGWRLNAVTVKPEYLQWTVTIAPSISPSDMIRLLREHTTQRIVQLFPRLRPRSASEDFWASGYLIVSGVEPPSADLMKDYLKQVHNRKN